MRQILEEDPRMRERIATHELLVHIGFPCEPLNVRIPAKADEAFALLQEAFAETGARRARREALKRAFEASGKGVEEFAQMYGVAVADVREAVA